MYFCINVLQVGDSALCRIFRMTHHSKNMALNFKLDLAFLLLKCLVSWVFKHETFLIIFKGIFTQCLFLFHCATFTLFLFYINVLDVQYMFER